MPRLLPVLGVLAATGIVGVVAGAWSYSQELSAARSAVAKGAKVVETSSGPIEYAEWGPGAGMPVLSIHGAGGGWDQGLANVKDLLGDAFRVIAPSRFGYLGTPVPTDSSPAAQADAHSALLGQLGLNKAVVLGISAGARSALELAIRHPEQVEALILIVPGTYSPTSPVNIEATRGNEIAFSLVNSGADLAWWMMEKLVPATLVRFVGVSPELLDTASPAERDRVTGIVSSIEPLSMRMAGINIDSNSELGPLPLDKVTAPTLIIAARDDLFNTLPAAEYAAAAIHGAKLVAYDTGGHLLVGREEETRAAVADFLKNAIPSVLPTDATVSRIGLVN